MAAAPRPAALLEWIFVRYLGSGSAAALTHFAVLIGLVETAAFDETVASALGFAAATAVNYSLQYYWVFASDHRHTRTFVRYLVVTLSMLAVNTGLFWWLVSGLGWWYPLAQALAIGVVMVLNFLLNRHFTFAAGTRGGTQGARHTAARPSSSGW